MPLAESVQPQRDKNSGNTRPVGLVTCPNCKVVMPQNLVEAGRPI